MNAAPANPSYDQIMSREHYATYRDGNVCYHTFTGSIRTRCNWMVPGAHPDEQIKAKAPVGLRQRCNRSTDINVARTMVFHAPTVGTYSVWMIPGAAEQYEASCVAEG